MVSSGRKWDMLEFCCSSSEASKNPFWDIEAYAVFSQDNTGQQVRIKGFYNGVNEAGEQTWTFRWTPCEAGQWRCIVGSEPAAAGLSADFTIEVSDSSDDAKGFLRAYSGRTWGFEFDNGEAFFPLGDTIYNLFGGQYCDLDVREILAYRKAQGINYIRARMQVSPYHYPTRSDWQTRDCWPWLGSSQWPNFRGFNLDYFRAVDQVMEIASELGLGMELIFEAWMLEFPFNDRARFLTEHEEHWIRYIISRYAAYPCVYVWCPANEYDLYPGKPDRAHISEANRWLKRLAGLTKSEDPYNHPVGAHQWVQHIPLHERLGDCESIDVYLVQSDWGVELSEFDRDPSLSLYIENQLVVHAPDRRKAVMCSEFGYEKAGGNFTVEVHDRMDEHHTRRGQWKAGFVGFPIVHGFNNTWGPKLTVNEDADGTRYLLPYYRFMTEVFPFTEMSPNRGIVKSDDEMLALKSPALCLMSEDASALAVYLPVGGTITLDIADQSAYDSFWYNPRTGESTVAAACTSSTFTSPGNNAEDLLNSDWVLGLNRREQEVN